MKTIIVMPHYLVSQRLVDLATNAARSIKATAPAAVLISVIDGPAIPGAIEAIAAHSDHVIAKPVNEGFAKTCNAGFALAFEQLGAEDAYIGCANNDIEVYPGWLEAMQDPFTRWDKVAITGLISNKMRVIEGTPIAQYQVKKITQGGQLGQWMQSGGLWLSTAAVLRKVGLFDEQFERGGFEDVDLFLRMRDTFGMRIIMSGLSCFWHEEGATRWSDDAGQGFGRESKVMEVGNGKKFYKKWGFNYWTRSLWREVDLWQP